MGMDYNDRKWKKTSVYLSPESKSIINILSAFTSESKTYVLNMLIQKYGSEILGKYA